MTDARLAADLATLDRDGFVIVPDAMPRAWIRALDRELADDFAATPYARGDFYGHRTKRFGRLLTRADRVQDLVLCPPILALAEAVLGSACERIQLNVAQAIAIHPGERAQFPHADQDMWGGVKGAHEFLLNVMWPLTTFTARNGATRLYPGTHRRPPQALDDLPAPVVAACQPGAAICFLGSTVHGGGANITTRPRRGIVVGYSLGWLKAYENPFLAYPPAVARRFPRRLTELLGYIQHRPNLGNFEGQCPSLLLVDTVPTALGAVDALRPDQATMLAAFARHDA